MHPSRGSAYAGIGSRRTPAHILTRMQEIAAGRAEQGWVLRTGMSPGADQAFHRGARRAGGPVELYLPWPGFASEAWCEEAGVAVHVRPSERAHALAARLHPGWVELSPDERALLARDCEQVLGADLDTPAAEVVCWTAAGSVDGSGVFDDGTGQALRLAHASGIPVVNLARC